MNKIQEIVCIGTNVKTGFRNGKVKIRKDRIPIYKFKKELDRLLNLFYSSNSDIFSRLALFHLFLKIYTLLEMGMVELVEL